MSAYQHDMTVDQLIAHLQRVAAAGYGDRPVTLDAYQLGVGIAVNERPDFPRAEALAPGRVTADQRTGGATLMVVLENWG